MISLIPFQKVKATTTYYNYGDIEITYNNYLYGFYVTSDSASGLPQDYKISSEVLTDLIISDVKGLQYELANRIDNISENLHGIVVGEWILDGTSAFSNFIFGSYVNALQATNSFIHDFIWREATTYSWNYYFTGSDPDYPGSGDYGTAYGFRFIGAAGEKFDIVLDANGDYYGHNLIGNWTPTEDPGPTNWILINQGLDNFYVPSVSTKSFNDLKTPYFVGKELHFFIYDSNLVETECVINDFTTVCAFFNFYNAFFYSVDQHSFTLTVGNQIYSSVNNLRTMEYRGIHTNYLYDRSSTGIGLYAPSEGLSPVISYGLFSTNINFPYHRLTGNNPTLYYPPQYLGYYNSNPVSGSGDLWLDSFSYTPNPTPNPLPDNPIPITSIPEDPEDPIPQTSPDPIPGIEYPINPTPNPLPPFATIVSGNDELWGVTLDFDGAQNSLLPYLNSLATFEFPSFDTLISDFSGSIIWVAQLMSVLYNGTSFNILFVVLCLFSLVSIIIGGYKLWNTTEPDPNNPGFRRTKKPPRGPKGRRKR